MKPSFLLPLLLFTGHAHAQVIYTDVVPDAVFSTSGDTCHLDLNNDGSDDFLIRFYRSSGNCQAGCTLPGARPSWVKVDPLLNNNVADTLSMTSELALDRVIDTSLTWGNVDGQILRNILTTHCIGGGGWPVCAPISTQGQWTHSSGTGKYLGLRFDIGGNTHYGWARLSLTGSISSFTLKDYAYNSVPDELILAGDTGSAIPTGLGRHEHSLMQVTPNPFRSTLSISIASEEPGSVGLTIRTLTGEVLEGWTATSSSPRSSFTHDLSSLAQGMYLLEVVINGDRFVRKIMKE